MTAKPDDAMNCDNRHADGTGCGRFGHSLDHHTLRDGALLCVYCGSTCPVKPYPQQVHLIVEGHHAKTQVPVRDPKTGETTFMEVPKKTSEGVDLYLCPNCGIESEASHTAGCEESSLRQIPHVGCHLYSRW